MDCSTPFLNAACGSLHNCTTAKSITGKQDQLPSNNAALATVMLVVVFLRTLQALSFKIHSIYLVYLAKQKISNLN